MVILWLSYSRFSYPHIHSIWSTLIPSVSILYALPSSFYSLYHPLSISFHHFHSTTSFIQSFQSSLLPLLLSIILRWCVHSLLFESDGMNRLLTQICQYYYPFSFDSIQPHLFDDRHMIDYPPFNYFNTFTIRSEIQWIDLHSLHSLYPDYLVFFYIASLFLYSIPFSIHSIRFPSIIIPSNPIILILLFILTNLLNYTLSYQHHSIPTISILHTRSISLSSFPIHFPFPFHRFIFSLSSYQFIRTSFPFILTTISITIHFY